MKVVSDTSPILALASIGELDLLRRLFERVHVPTAVDREILGSSRAAFRSAVSEGWVAVEALPPGTVRDPRLRSLGAGEGEAIALALETPESVILLDDRVARRTAAARGLQVVGTAGILALAFERGWIPDLEERLEELKATGFWISDRVFRSVLRR